MGNLYGTYVSWPRVHDHLENNVDEKLCTMEKDGFSTLWSIVAINGTQCIGNPQNFQNLLNLLKEGSRYLCKQHSLSL